MKNLILIMFLLDFVFVVVLLLSEFFSENVWHLLLSCLAITIKGLVSICGIVLRCSGTLSLDQLQQIR